jgi:hypothetical protein
MVTDNHSEYAKKGDRRMVPVKSPEKASLKTGCGFREAGKHSF